MFGFFILYNAVEFTLTSVQPTVVRHQPWNLVKKKVIEI